MHSSLVIIAAHVFGMPIRLSSSFVANLEVLCIYRLMPSLSDKNGHKNDDEPETGTKPSQHSAPVQSVVPSCTF